MDQTNNSVSNSGNTTNNNGSNNNKPRTGVADYFAILGVGDELVWKHSQKHNIYTMEEPEEDTPAVAQENTRDEEERFLREIVDVAILALDDSTMTATNDSDVASSSQVPSNTTTDDVSDHQPHLSAIVTTASSTTSHPVSPSIHSEATTGTTATATTTPHPRRQRVLVEPAVEPSLPLLQHWTCIQKTLPAATPGFVSMPTTEPRDEEDSDSDLEEATAVGPRLWNRDQVWEANVSWNFGLRATIQTHRAKVLRQLTHNPPLLPGSKWHSKLSQAVGRWHPLRNSRGRSMDEYDDRALDEWFVLQQQQKFVLAYRRRKQSTTTTTTTTPDEPPQVPEHNNLLDTHDDKQQSQCDSQRQQQQQQDNGVDSRPAVADLRLFYVRLHRNLLVPPKKKVQHPDESTTEEVMANEDDPQRHNKKPSLTSLFLEGAFQSKAKQLTSPDPCPSLQAKNDALVPVEEYLNLPGGFEEWSIPADYQWIRDPRVAAQEETVKKLRQKQHQQQQTKQSPRSSPKTTMGKRFRTKVLFPQHTDNDDTDTSREYIKQNQSHQSMADVAEEDEEGDGRDESSYVNGIEVAAMSLSPCESMASNGGTDVSGPPITPLEDFLPGLVTQPPNDMEEEALHNICYVPVVALRRQRIGDEERYHEDPAIVEMAVTFLDTNGRPVLPNTMMEDLEDDDDGDEHEFRVLGKTAWAMAGRRPQSKKPTARRLRRQFGSPTLLVRKNRPFGFADAAFATKVLDRFPQRNYKGLPLPQEELPMFCYPTGCRLFRTRYSDAPLAQYYGFVVKNERGDSIYVSCVSFMEPLTTLKVEQLAQMSEKKRRTSLPHKLFCEKRDRQRQRLFQSKTGKRMMDSSSDCSTEVDSNFILTGFDDMTTFENKTICLVSRFPFWTAFRKFLSHLHILSGSVSELPLERCISHLLLSVPLPRAGGHNVIVPLPALNEPMVLSLPPQKDFSLVDLPYQRLVACLEINTIVMLVLGMLALEKKVIVMSTRPSLVLDVCELLRSLLFPFDLCAPYVPRLTEPFKSSLDFPGAIFVGIHDDGSPHGLAATVRKELPEDSIVVDLETGEIESDMDRLDVIKSTWDILPKNARAELVRELQALCNDAGIIDGQEPLDSQYDSAFEVALPDAVDDFDPSECDALSPKEPLDDRAFRDAFLRFFCKALGGYERFLVVPDADFLVSGNEWFDSQGYLASVRSDRAPYLGALVSTQLFQSFIQKRTEASDVHCLLFDECMEEYHASPKPYGRLGDDMEMVKDEGSEKPRVVYSLLVDQSAAFPAGYDQQSFASNKSFDASDSDSAAVNALKASLSFAENHSKYAESAFNPVGDLVTGPTQQGLPRGQRYIYCIDGNPCFPHKFDQDLFLPNQPESWLVELTTAANPLLARSERELEEAERRRRQATSHSGFQKQRRCLWQLPKLMGSHFLGAWLLCIPAQVSQPRLSHDQQARYLIRALGALRLLRSKQRIVPDEAAYRALMVACGRSKSDRRTELVKLFGLLRSDGIFPSAVTLGQYTKGLAEGYSKQMSGSGAQDDDGAGVEVSETASRFGRLSTTSGNQRGTDWEAKLIAMDGHLAPLEEQGRRWRNKYGSNSKDQEQDDAKEHEAKKKRANRTWLPVVYSSSFAAFNTDLNSTVTQPKLQLVAVWSKTRCCRSCNYIPLEEEVQAGWDVVGGDEESSGAVRCPRCGALFVPMLGIREFTLGEAQREGMASNHTTDPILCSTADFHRLPPQICPKLSTHSDESTSSRVQFVAYKSPSAVRAALEQYVEEYGEEILEREKLRELDPEVFYNFWWYCARFSLPLPLSVAHVQGQNPPAHCIAFAGWDQTVAERACFSASLALSPLMGDHAEYSISNAHIHGHAASDQVDPFDDHPLLSRFNLQGYYSCVWDHEELSKILVSLVEACDKRDFKPVVECVLQKNKKRKEIYTPTAGDGGGRDEALSVEFDVYRTILYLAKYQCTTAFHVFFPAMIKPCKGYHYWCALGQPLPIFDRLLRDAVQRLSKEKQVVASDFVGDVALGFRCTFGHLI